MKKTGKILLSLLSIAILVGATVFLVLNCILPLDVWTHPALNFFFIIFAGFGLMTLVLAIKFKSPLYFLISAFLLGGAIFYLVAQYIYWWLGLIIMIIIWGIFPIISYMIAGNKTEDIALNKSEDYKDYKERRAEKEELEKAQEPEELPEIKSFK